MIKRYGESIRAGQVYRRRPGAYALLVRAGSVLTTVQVGEETEIQLPGGGIDPGEAPIPALHREVLEETGWRMDLRHKLGAFRRFTYMPEYDLWAEKICHVYLGRPTLQISAPTEPGHMALWLPLDVAATELAIAGDRAFVETWITRNKEKP